MRNWEKFEQEATAYLNETYKHLSVTFQNTGGKDANTSDIKVIKGHQTLFSIEAKYSPSQSGQFVLLEEDGKYVFSPKNRFEDNAYANDIIIHLNEYKSTYNPVGQESIEIQYDPNVFAGWIQDHYRSKESEFLIVSDQLKGYKAIIPLEELQRYFAVQAFLRRKRSGSRHLSQKRKNDALRALCVRLKGIGSTVVSVTEEIGRQKRVLVELDRPIEGNDCYFGEDYFLSPQAGNNRYYIKITAGTNNLNVLFRLVYIGPKENFGIRQLEKVLREKS
jgi:hypothetical protein